MKKWIFAASLLLVGMTASDLRADGYNAQCPGPFCNHKAGAYSAYGRPLPVYMAAPWYLYWPYDGHFLTPAPVYGAFYAPPVMGNYPVQPYFPTPQYVPPQGGVPVPQAPVAPPPPMK